jgi:hypothetical protein
MTDPDLDGDLDLLFAENTPLYIKNFIAPGPSQFHKFNSGQENGNTGKFTREFNYKNREFGQTPISADINGDNIDDIIWINMEGPVAAHISNGKVNNNYIIIELPKTGDFVNARVVVDTGTKKIYRENIIGGVGFGGDGNDGRVVVGLGKIDKLQKITIFLINGREIVIKNPKVNSVLKAKL